ncbi:hypothetical protein BN2127_JRS9_03379 [Bacillus subtilis]|uniref:hypothetical protein n=1 Tax=Bacillus TaxID=1386 RepID=UPI0006A8A329|nr:MULTISPECIES: hypothetical protein [Bacillus]MBU2661765.1 hypothetical protein [Bacillus cabrialesii]CUB20635.1 hypothetical protein BN2127_JRS2_03378 [Bacillus subtilis]CUB58328.1 hypothetical protein BN2127_JRS9_03379 [Bacillus subtilis]
MQETNENNFSQESTIEPKTSKCPQTIEEGVMHQFNKEFAVEVKYWNLGRLDAGDCEIRKTDITIFEDGHYKLHIELHDHGTIFGDHFDINVNLRGPAPQYELIYREKIKRSLVAGGDTTIDITTKEPMQIIKENFDRITAANRDLTCTPEY